jgi:hypothetical protein
MAITMQNYEWSLNGGGVYVAAQYPEAGNDFSIFVGGYGNNIQIPPFVMEDQFVVIEKFGSTAGVLSASNLGAASGSLTNWVPNGFIQIVINTTGYYQDPQNTWQHGISGDAAPYPILLTDEPPHYLLHPPIYVLPEQTWDLRYTMMNDLRGYVANRTIAGFTTTIPTTTQIAKCHVQYSLFDGPDSLVCHQLLTLGIPITVDNVEWYKRMLLQERGLDTETWEHYLQVSRAYREREERNDKLAGRTRKG